MQVIFAIEGCEDWKINKYFKRSGVNKRTKERTVIYFDHYI